jgi:thiol-disulfide isomerase/thioredoxin
MEKIESTKVISVGAGMSVPLFQRIYVTPEDSIKVCIAKVEQDTSIYYLKFAGKNAAQYNYYILEYYALKKYVPRYVKGSDLKEYKKSVELWRDKRYDFLSQARQKEHFSDGFLNYINADIINGYSFYLYYPLTYGVIKRSECPQSYFDDAGLIWNEDSQFHSVAANSWIKYADDNIYKSIDKIYELIISKFKGEQQDYMISYLISIYALKQDQAYNIKLNRIIDSALSHITNHDYIEFIKLSRDFYLQSDRYFPDNVLDSTYLKIYGKSDKITLREVFKMYEGKPLYIDVWASWCGPCRGDISGSVKAKEYLHGAGVEYLYFSIDENENSWAKAAETDGITKNQFLLCDLKSSPIVKFLNFNYIPFYILLHNDHKILTTLAPRPVEAFLKSLEEAVINLR